MTRELTFAQAVREATELCMAADPDVYVVGSGVASAQGFFGTTAGLCERFGPARLLDVAVSGPGVMGAAIGSALAGMRPIVVHDRVDLAVMGLEQLVGEVTRWQRASGDESPVPLVLRVVVGSETEPASGHSCLSQLPGLKVVMPSSPHDAKGMLIAAVEDDNPVVFVEHHGLLGRRGPVPKGRYRVELGQARIVREGRDLTIAAASQMTVESLRAAGWLSSEGISAEVVDVRSLCPLDGEAILASVRRTGRLIVADGGWRLGGLGSEIVARAAEECFDDLLSPPVRIALSECQVPAGSLPSSSFFPGAEQIMVHARSMLGRSLGDGQLGQFTPLAGYSGPN